VVAVLLRQRGYSLQANRKTIEGTRHPDRNAQFEHIAGGESRAGGRSSASPTIGDRGESDEVKAPEHGRGSGAWRVSRLRDSHRAGLSVFPIM
jgi:hypothetical protein